MPTMTPTPPPEARELPRIQKTKQSAYWLAELQTEARYRTTARVNGRYNEWPQSGTIDPLFQLHRQQPSSWKSRSPTSGRELQLLCFQLLCLDSLLFFLFVREGITVPVLSMTALELHIDQVGLDV